MDATRAHLIRPTNEVRCHMMSFEEKKNRQFQRFNRELL